MYVRLPLRNWEVPPSHRACRWKVHLEGYWPRARREESFVSETSAALHFEHHRPRLRYHNGGPLSIGLGFSLW